MSLLIRMHDLQEEISSDAWPQAAGSGAEDDVHKCFLTAARMIGPGPLAIVSIVEATPSTHNGTGPKQTSYELTVRKFRHFDGSLEVGLSPFLRDRKA